MATIPEALAIAIQHHQAGRLQAAEQIYRRILAAAPHQADALHLLGVIASQAGQPALAVEHIERAIALQGGTADFHANLGGAYHALRRIPEAVACYRRALALKPDFAEAHVNLGNALKDQGKLDEAAACYRRAIELTPDFAVAHNNLGSALKNQGKPDEARACYRRALELRPGYAEAHNNLGNTLKILGKPDEAIACYQRALELKPDYAVAHNNLGVALKEQGKLPEALACYRRALELEPGYAEAHNNLGNTLQIQGKTEAAIACYRRAVELKPDFVEALVNLANALKEQGNPAGTRYSGSAIVCYRRALELKPDFAEVHSNLGVALKEQGKVDEALTCYRRALELKPDLAEAHVNLGNALKEQGKMEESLACWRRALQLKPDFAEVHVNLGSGLAEMGDLEGAEESFRAALRHDSRFAFAHHNLAKLLGGKLPQHDLEAQRRLLEQDSAGSGEGELTDAQRLLLHFGLAQALDARGEYAQAAQYLERGNALQRSEWRRRGREYDPQEHAAFVTNMIAVCTPEFFARLRGGGLESELPVFVVGLPRSGTTLVEQILASHSQVYGAGEIKLAGDTLTALSGQAADPFEALRRMDRATTCRLASRHLEGLRGLHPAALRIVDKMPENYLYLGLLAGLFPRAKFIHCRRDLRDVAVSCWMTHFQEVRWANDQEHIAARFREHQRMMAHWRQVLPVPLFEVDYEETVADLEGVARRLVAWCGLEWEPACLEFHRAQRPVTTASAVQVRQPIFRTSVGRWRRYEQALASLFARLPPG